MTAAWDGVMWPVHLGSAAAVAGSGCSCLQAAVCLLRHICTLCCHAIAPRRSYSTFRGPKSIGVSQRHPYACVLGVTCLKGAADVSGSVGMATATGQVQHCDNALLPLLSVPYYRMMMMMVRRRRRCLNWPGWPSCLR
jgi:hypothetical protein